MNARDFRKFLAIGSGVGIEIGARDLRVVAARVRPSGARLLGAIEIAGFRGRPAAEWGALYAEFAKRAGASYLSATVLLPRRDVIVRFLSLPGVPARDIASAIELQIDSLHPFPAEQAVYDWARVGSNGTVLVAITRREAIERYIALFEEAGLSVAAFTFSAAALYSAVRLVSWPSSAGFLAFTNAGDSLDAYGESEARPLFSASFDVPLERAAALAAAELRLEPGVEPLDAAALLPPPKAAPEAFDLSRNALAYAAALAGACPRLAMPLNLLPPEHRKSNSRAAYIPAAALAALVVLALAAWLSITPIEDRKYLAAIETEISRLEPRARRAETLQQSIDSVRTRARLLDDFRRRTRADLDALAAATRLLPDSASLASLELSRNAIDLNGQAEQAEPLLKVLDDSPLFQGSEFKVPLARSGKYQLFRIRAAREGVPQ